METLQSRIERLVIELTTEKDELESKAKQITDRIAKLTLLSEGNPDPEFEDLISRLLEKSAPTPVIQAISVPRPVPVEDNTKRITVTFDKVYQTTQKFNQLFTMTDIVDDLCHQEGVTDEDERRRVRSAIYSMVAKMLENGRLIQVEAGKGRRPAQYRKVASNDYRRLPSFKTGEPEPIEVEREQTEESVAS